MKRMKKEGASQKGILKRRQNNKKEYEELARRRIIIIKKGKESEDEEKIRGRIKAREKNTKKRYGTLNKNKLYE